MLSLLRVVIKKFKVFLALNGIRFIVNFKTISQAEQSRKDSNLVRLTKMDKNIFKVCKSVHHRTIQINHQPDATIFQFIILTFIYSSTCFGRFHAHHQELNDCSGSLWFYLRIMVTVVLCSWSGRL